MNIDVDSMIYSVFDALCINANSSEISSTFPISPKVPHHRDSSRVRAAPSGDGHHLHHCGRDLVGRGDPWRLLWQLPWTTQGQTKGRIQSCSCWSICSRFDFWIVCLSKQVLEYAGWQKTKGENLETTCPLLLINQLKQQPQRAYDWKLYATVEQLCLSQRCHLMERWGDSRCRGLAPHQDLTEW